MTYPEYTLSEKDKEEYIQSVNARFLWETDMTEEERHAVAAWMDEGHCIKEQVYSPWLPSDTELSCSFLDAYRLERDLGRHMNEYWKEIQHLHDENSRLSGYVHEKGLDQDYTAWCQAAEGGRNE